MSNPELTEGVDENMSVDVAGLVDPGALWNVVEMLLVGAGVERLLKVDGVLKTELVAAGVGKLLNEVSAGVAEVLNVVDELLKTEFGADACGTKGVAPNMSGLFDPLLLRELDDPFLFLSERKGSSSGAAAAV